MIFNSDGSKKAQEVIYLVGKHKKLLILLWITFEVHLPTVSKKPNRTINLLRELQSVLPRITLVTIYKAFVRPHLDYGDILYDQAFNNSFHDS